MMPLHRRLKTPREKADHPPSGEDKEEDTLKLPSPPSAISKTRHKPLLWGLLCGQAALLVFVAFRSRQHTWGKLSTLLATTWITSLPMFMILAVSLGLVSTDADLPHQRYIPLVVMATVVGNQLPTYVSSGMACLGLLLFGLATRPTHKGENVYAVSSQSSGLTMRAALSALLMTTVLLTENFFIWVVSATYKASQVKSNLPAALQDNGQLVLKYFLNQVLELSKRDVVVLRNKINVEWILASGLGTSLVALVMQGKTMRRNLFLVAIRALLTLAIARSIRTVSFLITVLPSQHPQCYFNHFPYPPPDDWFSWLMVGFIPQADGGCNDLIISGHATVTSTLACVVVSIVGKPLFTTALWMMIAFDYMVEVYEGFHYSVDMWLGAVLVNFIWNVLAPVERISDNTASAVLAKEEFRPIADTGQVQLLKYAIPALGAYVQVTGLIPKDLANYTILAIVVAVVYQLTTTGVQHYTQHCLFSLLYLALGIYL